MKRIFPLEALEEAGMPVNPKAEPWVRVAVALWCRHCGAYRLNYDGARWVSPLASRLIAKLGDRVVLRRRVPVRDTRQLELIQGGKGGNDDK